MAKTNPTARLTSVPSFSARGMRRLRAWRLTEMNEFRRMQAYHGEIWATRDGRLLVRFRSHLNRFDRHSSSYEVCGISAAQILEGMGNVISIRYGKNGVTITSDERIADGEVKNCLSLSWMPACIREEWAHWRELVGD